MLDKTQILSVLRANRAELDKMQINRLALFGSHINGKATKESDVDLLVDFAVTPDFFEFVRVKERLEQILNNTPVDLVTFHALKSARQKEILKDIEDV